jgi:formamidopyrimidine-DNA glycosylase
MPELPEVETFVRQLQPLVGQAIQRVEVLDDRLGLSETSLVGSRVSAVERRGKWIVLRLQDRGDLVVHLRMSGRLRTHRSEREVRYTRMALHMDSGETIYFVNPRRLGTVTHHIEGFQPEVGIDPTDRSFTPSALAALAARSRLPVKLFLMDQRRIAGVGNIYAAEALWRGGISPHRPANALSPREIRRLHRSLVSVLNDAIVQQGTTLGEGVSNYAPIAGEAGEFGNRLSVYGRMSRPCERCGTMIARVKQGGRSTYYCSQCQV